MCYYINKWGQRFKVIIEDDTSTTKYSFYQKILLLGLALFYSIFKCHP